MASSLSWIPGGGLVRGGGLHEDPPVAFHADCAWADAEAAEAVEVAGHVGGEEQVVTGVQLGESSAGALDVLDPFLQGLVDVDQGVGEWPTAVLRRGWPPRIPTRGRRAWVGRRTPSCFVEHPPGGWPAATGCAAAPGEHSKADREGKGPGR